MDNGGFFVTTKKTFSTLQELISYYMETRDEWEIPRSSVQLIRKLGSGNFGEVWYERSLYTSYLLFRCSREFQIFECPYWILLSARYIRQLEVQSVLSSMFLPFCEEPIYIVTEYMAHGSLLEHLRGREGRGLKLPALIDMAAQPTNCECPDSVYNIMLNCWEADPEKRPTFEYLFGFFDDYFVSTEPSYRDAEDF
ncbi:hypothetical protein HPB49_021009 [Dermacentor silvarum]|uniref:Uncharacterized protein n=1 Tax=Dermacentor silvarum TaxID=543639 RepID=A0ACB8DR18_DERSI|nr:hypothetical protein HPB49_021009 [Dermacentor silvarum]